jgi:acetyl-CoA carboxylase biotin carboxyl carrier protein
MELNMDNVLRLMQAFGQSGLTVMKIKTEDGELSLGKDAPEGAERAGKPADAAAVSGNAASPAPAKKESEKIAKTDAAPGSPGAGTVLGAPIAGIFHLTGKDGEEPIVSVGKTVKKGDTVALMEAMKMVSELKAPCDGTVLEIMAKDGEFCEYNAPLMRFGGEADV